MSTHRLQLDDNEPEFRLIGISCHQKDYRAAWAVGQALDVIFEKQEDWAINMRKKDQFVVAVFSYYTVLTENYSFGLVANLNENRALVPELSQFDYMLIISGIIDSEYEEALLIRLKRHPLIQFCVFYDPLTIKNWESLPQF